MNCIWDRANCTWDRANCIWERANCIWDKANCIWNRANCIWNKTIYGTGLIVYGAGLFGDRANHMETWLTVHGTGLNTWNGANCTSIWTGTNYIWGKVFSPAVPCYGCHGYGCHGCRLSQMSVLTLSIVKTSMSVWAAIRIEPAGVSYIPVI